MAFLGRGNGPSLGNNNSNRTGNFHRIPFFYRRYYYIPLDNSDLIDRYISFEKQGIEHAVDSLLEVYPEFKDKVLEKLLSK